MMIDNLQYRPRKKVCSSRVGKRKRSFLFKVWPVQIVREVKN